MPFLLIFCHFVSLFYCFEEKIDEKNEKISNRLSNPYLKAIGVVFSLQNSCKCLQCLKMAHVPQNIHFHTINLCILNPWSEIEKFDNF